MSAHAVTFYFDYNSPYSYIASHQIEGLCERAGARLLWMPFVLGGAFRAFDTTPPHARPGRREYLFQDLRDLTAYYGIPYRERTEFLFKPVLSLRATLAVPQGAERARAVHALYRGAWSEDRDLGRPEVVAALLDEAGLDGRALVEQAGGQAIKDELRAITDGAVSRGVFGAPTFFVDDGKMFWGQDRLPLLEHYLRTA